MRRLRHVLVLQGEAGRGPAGRTPTEGSLESLPGLHRGLAAHISSYSGLSVAKGRPGPPVGGFGLPRTRRGERRLLIRKSLFTVRPTDRRVQSLPERRVQALRRDERRGAVVPDAAERAAARRDGGRGGAGRPGPACLQVANRCGKGTQPTRRTSRGYRRTRDRPCTEWVVARTAEGGRKAARPG